VPSDEPYFEPNEAALLTVYKVLSDARIDYNVRKWDTIRTAALFELGVLAAAGGLLSRRSAPDEVYFVAAGVLLATSWILWLWVRNSVTREAGLQYTVEFSMYQIEKLLGLHRKLHPDQRWLPDYEYLFGEKGLTWTFRVNASDTSVRKGLHWWVEEKKATQSFRGRIDALFLSFLLVTSVGFALALTLLGLKSH